MKKEKFNWIPCSKKQPYNGQRVLLSFADEKQGPLVGTWKVDEEGGSLLCSIYRQNICVFMLFCNSMDAIAGTV